MMDIKEIEEYLANNFAFTPQEQIIPWLQCHLLLHIYRKLEDIDGSLGSVYSQLNAMEQSLPSKW